MVCRVGSSELCVHRLPNRPKSAASCSLPLIFKSYMIIEKTSKGEFIPWSVPGGSWIDGSVDGYITSRPAPTL